MEQKIFVTADLHYDHVNIIKGQSVWNNLEACRDFENIEDMNSAIIKSINNTVSKYDILYLAGDLAFKNVYSLYHLMKNIRCQNIYCILGNHDQAIRDNKRFNIQIPESSGVILAEEFLGKTLLPGEKYSFRTHEMFKDIHKRVELTHNKQKFIIDHYPLDTWNQAMHGSIMIHGHVHGALDTSDLNMYYKRIDVDWGKFKRPISLDEIAEMMKDRKNLEY